ncbi:hypothetical protein LWI29_030713 [Acer saccharum]|uniref:Uncharacterized protein n=1 Tax=Acer saccharum TaxID=4024 RepID=A0AA39VS85_ACESA|nr:hypothetical protein LWI29_030713 [Acer saccharum]
MNNPPLLLLLDCSISSGVGWVGIDPYTSSSYSLFGHKKEEEEDDDHDHEEEENEESGNHIETLPLFPMHDEDNNFNTTFNNVRPDPSSYYYYSGRYGSNDGHGSFRASLVLSLNSYTSWSSAFPATQLQISKNHMEQTIIDLPINIHVTAKIDIKV